MGSGARVAAGTQRTVADSRIAAAVALAAASATAPAAAPAALRQGNTELTALDAIGVKGAYNSKCPWEYVFRQLPVEFAFWKRELEDPALLILARAPVAAITSEAPVAKTRDQHITQVAVDVQLTGLERQGLPSKRQRVGIPSLARVYKYDDQGHYKCNRRGVQLCVAFQTGSCSSPCPQQLAHQCKICLYPKDCLKAGTSVTQQAGHDAEKEKGKKQKGRKEGQETPVVTLAK